MYLGADTPGPVKPEEKKTQTTSWVGAVEPIGNAVTGLVGAFFGRSNPGQPPVVVEKTDNTALYVGGGVALLGATALVIALTKKKRR